MQTLLSEKLNVLRNADGLTEARDSLTALLREVCTYTSLLPFEAAVKLLRLENDLIAALALANAALLRDETCGCHVRTDCPDADESGKKYRILLSRAADGGMSVRRAPV